MGCYASFLRKTVILIGCGGRGTPLPYIAELSLIVERRAEACLSRLLPYIFLGSYGSAGM